MSGNQCMTIESFFLADYARVKERNEELERQMREAERRFDESMSESGFVDLREPVEMVRVCGELSNYDLFSSSDAPFKDAEAFDLREIAAMGDRRLSNMLMEKRSKWNGRVLEVERKRFPFTVEFRSYKGAKRYAYDPDGDETQLVEICDSPETGCWIAEYYETEALESYLASFRDVLESRIAELEGGVE